MKNKKFGGNIMRNRIVILLSMTLGLTACANAPEIDSANVSVNESVDESVDETVDESVDESVNELVDESLDGSVTVLDTPEIIAEMEKARNLAGDDKSLVYTQRLQSRDLDENGIPTQAPQVNTDGSETYLEPIQLFDNLYYIGGTGVGSFIFTTTEGYIMIDAGYSYSPEEFIIPGMKALGLDPSKIKYLLITHAGPDHIGGAKYFQENYGTQIVMSAEEWDSASNQNNDGIVFPDQDIIGTDGQELTLGTVFRTMLSLPSADEEIVPIISNTNPK